MATPLELLFDCPPVLSLVSHCERFCVRHPARSFPSNSAFLLTFHLAQEEYTPFCSGPCFFLLNEAPFLIDLIGCGPSNLTTLETHSNFPLPPFAPLYSPSSLPNTFFRPRFNAVQRYGTFCFNPPFFSCIDLFLLASSTVGLVYGSYLTVQSPFCFQHAPSSFPKWDLRKSIELSLACVNILRYFS